MKLFFNLPIASKALFLGLCTLTVSAVFSGSANAGIIHTASYNGNTYHLLDTDGTKWWFEAEEEAIALGGHLVTINDGQENSWLLDTFGQVAINYANANNLPDRTGISLWIGLNDLRTEGEFEWVSGEAVDYLNWASGQPEDNFPDEDFAGMFVNWGPVGQWHDIISDTRFGDLPFAVVEVAPEPTTPVSTPEPMTGLGCFVVAGLAMAIGKKQKPHS